MKRLIIPVIIIVMLMPGCSTASSIDKSEPEVIRVEGDRIVYSDLKSLTAASELIVIGEYADDTEQNLKYEYSEGYKKDVLMDAVSTNTIHVKKILKGSPDKKELKISQRYGTEEERNALVTFSSMTPMKKGEEWIFFLYYDAVNDTYWCAGDYSGRYPLPEGAVLEACKKAKKIRSEYADWLNLQKDKIVVPAGKVGTESANKVINELLENEKAKLLSGDDGNVYYFEDEEELKKIEYFEKSFKSCVDETDPAWFGVYENNDINLNLYNEIINTFDCY
ncbi:MAG: hypothetical protein IKR54_08395 [Lachnospiraceae bacterium]|nr:hypothetical protein [Lachnospiraceae bacterium]